jgi:hypothetical protein
VRLASDAHADAYAYAAHAAYADAEEESAHGDADEHRVG